MKRVLLLVLAFGMTFVLAAEGSAKDLKTVDYVDISKYVGKWYEIASIPQKFAKQCVSDTTAEYELDDKNKVSVLNSCSTQEGKRSTAKGKAKVVDKQTNSKLKVTFVKILGWIYLFGGEYWIINLAEDYRYAVVGHPSLKYGWILSRTPELPQSDLVYIETYLKSVEYDTCQFDITPQAGGKTLKRSLCEEIKASESP